MEGGSTPQHGIGRGFAVLTDATALQPARSAARSREEPRGAVLRTGLKGESSCPSMLGWGRSASSRSKCCVAVSQACSHKRSIQYPRTRHHDRCMEGPAHRF